MTSSLRSDVTASSLRSGDCAVAALLMVGAAVVLRADGAVGEGLAADVLALGLELAYAVDLEALRARAAKGPVLAIARLCWRGRFSRLGLGGTKRMLVHGGGRRLVRGHHAETGDLRGENHGTTGAHQVSKGDSGALRDVNVVEETVNGALKRVNTGVRPKVFRHEDVELMEIIVRAKRLVQGAGAEDGHHIVEELLRPDRLGGGEVGELGAQGGVVPDGVRRRLRREVERGRRNATGATPLRGEGAAKRDTKGRVLTSVRGTSRLVVQVGEEGGNLGVALRVCSQDEKEAAAKVRRRERARRVRGGSGDKGVELHLLILLLIYLLVVVILMRWQRCETA